MSSRSSAFPFLPKKAPNELTASLFQNAATFKDIDTSVWLYLCDLIPNTGGSIRERKLAMLKRVSQELGRYYLSRGFDWERDSEGLEGCVMLEDDEMLLDNTVKAYEALGAVEHAQIVSELIVLSDRRRKDISEAEYAGAEFNYEDGAFDAFEKRWDAASSKFDFYQKIFADMKRNPERYVHP